jgi:hypothetical protein
MFNRLNTKHVRFEVFTAVGFRTLVFWVVTPYSPGSGYQVCDEPANSAFRVEVKIVLFLENGDAYIIT